MKAAVVFSGSSALDFQEVRSSVVRIPEVCRRLRQAQDQLDESGVLIQDLTQYLCSEDQVFLSHLRLKTLVSSIVQIGLYDRYQKTFLTPHALVGNMNGESAFNVTSGFLNFSEMFSQLTRVLEKRGATNLGVVEETLLSGVSLVDYGISVPDNSAQGSFRVDREAPRKLEEILVYLKEQLGIRKIVCIGPGQMLIQETRNQLDLQEIQVVESIDIDPLLSWFWTGVKNNQLVG